MESMKKLHDIIFVSDKIVTYKAAAAILDVNVNEVKSILEKFVKNKEKNALNVSYIIGGKTIEDKHKIILVSQNKYEEVKSQFKNITFNHIYSIQKCPLVDWTPVFNVDDFLYDKKESSAVTLIKKEVDVIEQTKEGKSTQVHKKGSISNFFSQTNTQKKTNEKTVKKEVENDNKKNKKQAKPSILSNFINKTSNKENLSKNTVNKENLSKNPVNKENLSKNSVNKEEISDDDDDEEIFKVSKKRSRVITDDDEQIPNKCPKVDILDDPKEEEEYHSDEDMFGSPEKDEDLMKNSEELTKDSEEYQNSEENMNSEELFEEAMEESETNTEDCNMYEDDEGYFVTEKKKTPKREPKAPKKQVNKKEIEEKKAAKKEIAQKIKNNTNQKSILNFFQKK